MNGKLLDDLKELASKKDISTEAALRLICTVQADFAETLFEMERRDRKADEEREQLAKSLTVLAQNSEKQTADLKKLNDKLEKKVFENPLVVIGNFIKEHPKISTTIFIVFVILSNLWFVSGFRRAILLLLNVPQEIIDAIAP